MGVHVLVQASHVGRPAWRRAEGGVQAREIEPNAALRLVRLAPAVLGQGGEHDGRR